MKTVFILPSLYRSYLAQIPTRFLREEQLAPSGRPQLIPELGRALTTKEKYRVTKMRKQGKSSAYIRRHILNGQKELL